MRRIEEKVGYLTGVLEEVRKDIKEGREESREEFNKLYEHLTNHVSDDNKSFTLLNQRVEDVEDFQQKQKWYAAAIASVAGLLTTAALSIDKVKKAFGSFLG